jgi:hypothetical protein
MLIANIQSALQVPLKLMALHLSFCNLSNEIHGAINMKQKRLCLISAPTTLAVLFLTAPASWGGTYSQTWNTAGSYLWICPAG